MNGAPASPTQAVNVAARGADALSSRQPARTAGASSGVKYSSTTSASVPTGCSRNSKPVTTPKLPPPPCSPQNSSSFCSASARTCSPSAVTSSKAVTLSQVSPCSRASQPIPPPSVSPPTPVWETLPAVVASPCAWAARSSAPSSAPPPTHARRAPASTRTSQSGVRSSISPSSGTASPRTPWPPQRTPSSSPAARPARTAAATSAALAQRAIARGRRSTIAFQTVRAAS